MTVVAVKGEKKPATFLENVQVPPGYPAVLKPAIYDENGRLEKAEVSYVGRIELHASVKKNPTYFFMAPGSFGSQNFESVNGAMNALETGKLIFR